MRMDRLIGTMGPLATLAALSACHAFGGGDGEGVPLAELDLNSGTPEAVALAGPDTVFIASGEPFSVTAEGEAADKLRFKLENGTLAIVRSNESWFGGDAGGTATVRIVMPAPRRLAMAGSGHMTSAALASDAELSIAGSGTLETPRVETESLKVSIAGSGDYLGSGHTAKLDLSIAGSGHAKMANLKADRAEVNIAGSGDGAFASDGEVEARILGSGTVTVRGSARCKVSAIGSGSLVCERAAETAD